MYGIYLAITAALAIDHLEMSVDNPIPRVGENVSIAYTVYGKGGSEFVQLEKVVPDEDAVTIATNHVMEDDFSKVKRYSIILDSENSDEDNGKFKFIFTITGWYTVRKSYGLLHIFNSIPWHKLLTLILTYLDGTMLYK